jgi:glucan phosphoethanolaminetransferase (alkaline phosphatase superfamily)
MKKIIFTWPIFSILFFISFVTIIIYKYSFINLTYSVIFYHLFIVIILSFILTLFGILICYLKIRLPKLYALFWALFLLFLFLVYLLSFIGNNLTGAPISYKIVQVYFFQFKNILKALNAPIFITYFLITLIVITHFSVFFYFSNQIWSKLESLKSKTIRIIKSKERNDSKKKLLALITICILFLFGIDFFKFSNFNTRLMSVKEPIYLVFTPKKISNISLSKNMEPLSIKKNYPKNLNFEKKNVILIIVDDLRADYLSCYGYPQNTSPFLNNLIAQKKAVKINNVFANGSASFSGILSILTSKLWTHIANRNFSIQDLLKSQRYRTNFILSGDHTSFYLLRDIFGNNIDFYNDGFTSNKSYVNDDDLVIESLKKAEVKDTLSNFYYLHLMSTHVLGIRKSKNIVFKPASAISKNPKIIQNNYKNGIIQTDNYIREIFDVLDKKKLLKNSLVIITSDHGESLGEKGRFGHGNGVFVTETLIPLIIFDSSNNLNYFSDYATQEDISATIVDRLGLPKPVNWEGESLFNSKPKRKFSYHCYNNTYAIICYENNGLIKYFFNKNNMVEEVFDLKKDIKESRNIIKIISPKELDLFRQLMKQFISDITE